MAAPLLRIRLLGGVEIHAGSASPATLTSRRAESLLALLLLGRGTPQRRERLAFLLWPDSTEAQARTNLRHLLHTLRSAVPALAEVLDVTSRTVLVPDAPTVWLDVQAIEAALRRAAGASEADRVDALQDAVALYRGPLLDGHDEDWVLAERERLRGQHVRVVLELVERLVAAGRPDVAVAHAERLVATEPLEEAAHRLLITVHSARGDRGRALRAYHACAETLEQELGIEPSPETRAAYRAVLEGTETPAPAADPPSAVRATGGRGPRRLVGRDEQWSTLIALWAEVMRGAPQLAVVTGEPGIGKTTLVEEVRSWCAAQGAAVAHARSYRAEGALAFAPVVAWLRSSALSSAAARLDPTRRAEVARLMPELGDPAVPSGQPAALDAADQRRRLHDALVSAIVPRDRPLVLVADDLHWADHDSLQVLHQLLRGAGTAPLLLLATVRDEDLTGNEPLEDLLDAQRRAGRLTSVALERLTAEETADLAAQEAGRRLSTAVATRLHAWTEGNPLFVLEAVRSGWADSDTGPASGPARITPLLQATISERLRQLSPGARRLVGLAATIGRAFTVDVLTLASDMPEVDLVGNLDELWRRRLVREQGSDAYDFTHDRIREVAHAALGPAERRRNHGRIADALLELHAADLGPLSAQVAVHQELGGQPERAARSYAAAADTARRMRADAEAIRLLERGLDLLDALPPTPDRQSATLELLTAVQAPLGHLEGYGSPRLAAARDRALALARQLGTVPDPPLLHSLSLSHLVRGDIHGAEQVSQRLADPSRREDRIHLAQRTYLLGIAAYWRGEFAQARDHFRVVVGLRRPQDVPTHLSRFGLDPGTFCQARLANTLWYLGHPTAAVAARDTALAMADDIDHPYTRGASLVFGALLAMELGDDDGVRTLAGHLEADLGRHSAPTEVVTRAILGYLDVRDGRREAGIAVIRRTLDGIGPAEDAPGERGLVGRLLLQACLAAGDVLTGLATAEQLLAWGGAAAVAAADAHRLRGWFRHLDGAEPAEVLPHLHAALDTARRQGARSLELRAATSLLAVQQARGDARGRDDARDLLSAVVEGMPEGTDTADRRAALALLA